VKGTPGRFPSPAGCESPTGYFPGNRVRLIPETVRFPELISRSFAGHHNDPGFELRQRSESDALQSAAFMQRGFVVDLMTDISIMAAKVSAKCRLPMADSIIPATSGVYGATIWTQDSDFEGIDGVQYVVKKNG
jgi:hypothetical protein